MRIALDGKKEGSFLSAKWLALRRERKLRPVSPISGPLMDNKTTAAGEWIFWGGRSVALNSDSMPFSANRHTGFPQPTTALLTVEEKSTTIA